MFRLKAIPPVVSNWAVEDFTAKLAPHQLEFLRFLGTSDVRVPRIKQNPDWEIQLEAWDLLFSARVLMTIDSEVGMGFVSLAREVTTAQIMRFERKEGFFN